MKLGLIVNHSIELNIEQLTQSLNIMNGRERMGRKEGQPHNKIFYSCSLIIISTMNQMRSNRLIGHTRIQADAHFLKFGS